MMLKLRTRWREAQGPFSLRMPDDGTRPALAGPYPQAREDSEDCRNDDGTWGPKGKAGSEGGSGIVLGESCADLENVLIAEEAVHRRPPTPPWPGSYDWEHWIRQTRYAFAAWEMTGDPKFARRIVEYDEFARRHFSHTAPVNTGPDWIPHGPNDPFTLSQYHYCAGANPGQALHWNGRAVGWIAYGHAMRQKVAPYDTDWARMLLATCRMAAVHRTGQQIRDSRAGINETDVQYSFHWGLLAHGVMAVAYRIHDAPPDWVIDGMHAMYEQAVVMSYGVPSMPAFLRTRSGHLVPATGEGQQADPMAGVFQENCIALHKMTGDPEWLERAAKFGAKVYTPGDDQSRKSSLLIRGLRG